MSRKVKMYCWVNIYSCAGGPLFTKKEGEWVQLGLVSWGPTEITDSSFDVNTDVLYFRDWIVAHKDRLAISHNFLD